MTAAAKTTDPLAAHLAGVLGYVSLDVLGRQLLGPDSTSRAARDWCKRHRVAYKRDGKYNFVRVEDVRRALDGLAAAANDDAKTDRVSALVARAMGRR